MITQIDRKTIRTLNAEIEAALQAIAQKHGVAIKTGNSSFTANNYTTKLSVSVVSGDGQVLSPEAEAYNRYKPIMGFSKDLGDTFTQGRSTFTITGLKPRLKK